MLLITRTAKTEQIFEVKYIKSWKNLQKIALMANIP